MTAFVFLGPTLSVDEARRHLDATYLPPVAVGDVYKLVERERPSVIGIVDGLFELVPSVWHKEILHALSKGVRVVGSSSMGALRAAELAAFGMEPVGEIAQRYCSGDLEDDDEVTVVHGPRDTGYRQISEAMVNLRFGLQQATQLGVVSPKTADALVAAAKSWFYPERSWEALLAYASRAGIAGEEIASLREFVGRVKPNLKRDDAVALLEYIAQSQPISPHQPTFELQTTTFWHDLVEECRALPGGGAEQDASALGMKRHVQLTDPRKAYVRSTLLRVLVEHEAKRRSVDTSDERIEVAKRRFLLARNVTDEDRDAYLARCGLSGHELHDLARTELLVDELAKIHAGACNEALAGELKRAEAFGAVSERARLKQRVASEKCLGNPTLDDVGVSLEELVDWFERRFGRLDDEIDLDRNARLRGFADGRDFLSELILEYLVETR